MMNYGIFTQIYVFQVFNAKETKPARKVEKMAKAGNAIMSRHNYNIVATKP